MPLRKPTESEIKLIAFLAKQGNYNLPAGWSETILVNNMDEGGTGSLTIQYTDGKKYEQRRFGRELSEYTFKDKDRVPVTVTLNLDEDDNLYELDVWKLDFSSVIAYPEL